MRKVQDSLLKHNRIESGPVKGPASAIDSCSCGIRDKFGNSRGLFWFGWPIGPAGLEFADPRRVRRAAPLGCGKPLQLQISKYDLSHSEWNVVLMASEYNINVKMKIMIAKRSFDSCGERVWKVKCVKLICGFNL